MSPAKCRQSPTPKFPNSRRTTRRHRKPKPPTLNNHLFHQQQQEDEDGGKGAEEEQWQFQAECSMLRMEREVGMKKLDCNRATVEAALRSAAVESTLASGRRRKISEWENAEGVLEEEIQELSRKFSQIQKSSSCNNKILNCSNFDAKANLLQRHLEDLTKLEVGNQNENKPMDEKMGEFRSVITSDHASTSKRVAELPETKCSGRCKTVIRRVVEQVRAETEQWSQMQEMLRQVRGEMEELQVSRDFWEDRAHTSDYEIRSLRNLMEEWKEKAIAYENRASELEIELYAIRWEKAQKSKVDSNQERHENNDAVPMLPLGKQLKKEKHALSCRTTTHCVNEIEEEEERLLEKDTGPLSLAKQLAREKKMFLHRLKENRHNRTRKCSREEMSNDATSKPYLKIVTGGNSPLKDIGNSSCLARQSSRAVLSLNCAPESFRTRESFRK